MLTEAVAILVALWQLLPAGGATARVRAPLFLYCLAIELSRSFFPVHLARLARPAASFAPDLVAALPLSLWVLALLAGTPLGARLCRHGARPAMLAGMLPSAAGLLGTGLATDFWSLMAWRCLTALGFGMVTAAAMVFVAEAAPAARRARGMGFYVAAVMAAGLSGAVLGGRLAEAVGVTATFAAAGLLVLAAALLAWVLLPGHATGPLPMPRPGRAELLPLLRDRRLLALLLLSAAPARLMLTGFAFYLIPVALHAAGHGPAESGAALMAFFLALLAVNPLAASWADRWQAHRRLMLAGGVISALGVLWFAAAALPWSLAAVALAGSGQALVTAPQAAALPDLFPEHCRRCGLPALIAVYRMVERLGSILGPLVAAALVQASGAQAAAAWLGVLLLLPLPALAMAMRDGPGDKRCTSYGNK